MILFLVPSSQSVLLAGGKGATAEYPATIWFSILLAHIFKEGENIVHIPEKCEHLYQTASV